MKTKWGSCNIDVHPIWLNLELAKKSVRCRWGMTIVLIELRNALANILGGVVKAAAYL